MKTTINGVILDTDSLWLQEQQGCRRKFSRGSHSPFYIIKNIEGYIENGDTERLLSELALLTLFGFQVDNKLFTGSDWLRVYEPVNDRSIILRGQAHFDWYESNGYKPRWIDDIV